ncbi:MAG: hypothetical protein V4581_07310 [Bacteroidota bacterium]
MANVRNLKKDINFVFSDIIEAVYINTLAASGNATEAGDAIIDEAIATFDSLVKEINAKGVENKKAHFAAINKKFEESASQLVAKINAL